MRLGGRLPGGGGRIIQGRISVSQILREILKAPLQMGRKESVCPPGQPPAVLLSFDGACGCTVRPSGGSAAPAKAMDCGLGIGVAMESGWEGAGKSEGKEEGEDG